MLIILKEGSRIRIQEEDGKIYVYYDFKDHSFYEPNRLNKITEYSARTRLSKLRLTDINIDKSDEKIIELMRYISIDTSEGRTYCIKSLATLINNFKKYSNLEKLISMGVKCINSTSYTINKKTYSEHNKVIPNYIGSDLPSSKVIRYFVDNNIPLKFMPSYEETVLLQSLKEILQLDDISDIFIKNRYYGSTERQEIYKLKYDSLNKLNETIKQYNLNRKVAINYVASIAEHEGIILYEVIELFIDYLSMSITMLGSQRKVNKYPRHLRSVHDICVYNYNKRKKEYDEISFSSKYTGNYLYVGKKYSIIEPKSSKDVIREGTTLHHCVGSYIDKIIDGKTIVVFLRDNKDLDNPLLTVEIKNGAITQVQGIYRRDITQDERDFLIEYCNKLNIAYNC